MFEKKLATLMVVCFATVSCLAQSAPAAELVVKEACERAAKENKNVFVIFHASWCGWCHKMDSCMSDKSCKIFFDDNYITCHITVDESKGKEYLENAGAKALLKKYHGDGGGIPFWIILDKNSVLLADSKMRPDGAGLTAEGDNIGCPAKPEELAYFTKVLKNTSRISASGLSVIADRFGKNDTH